MLSWLKRLVDRTPQLSTDDLCARPPPPPPEDLTAEVVTALQTPSAGVRGEVLTEETAEVRALSSRLFEHFRAHPDELPSFPALAIQIFEIIERPRDEVDVDRLIQVVSREPATAALMLRVANSSRYGGRNPISSVRDAVVRLGITEVSNLAVAAASRALFDSDERCRLAEFGGLWPQRWRHALTTAFSASWLSMETRTGQPQEAFVAGLLHDVGKTLALRGLSQLVTDGRWTNRLTPASIEFTLESAHLDIGAEAAVRWGLPEFVIDVCQAHHSDDEEGLPMVVRLASDVYDLKYNPLYRVTLIDSIVVAARTLDVNERGFAELSSQVASFAASADEIATAGPRSALRTG